MDGGAADGLADSGEPLAPASGVSVAQLGELADALDAGALAFGPVRIDDGHLYLPKEQRERLGCPGVVAVAAEVGGVCWIGPPREVEIGGGMVHRAECRISSWGYLYLTRRVRDVLALRNPHGFGALVVSSPAGGLLLVPVDAFARRAGLVRR